MLEKLKELRRERGLSQEQVADDIGLSVSYYSRLESGARHVNTKWLQKLANYFHCEIADLFGETSTLELVPKPVRPVKVRGSVEAGVWRDALEWSENEQYTITVPMVRSTAKSAFALKVQGNSMNREYPPDSVVICVHILDYHDELKDGDHVICERHAPDGSVEATIKEMQTDENGKVWLWPRSDDPQHQQPIDIEWPPPTNGEDHPTVEITAVVIGSYKERP